MNNILEKSLQRRSVILGGAKGTLLLGLVARLYTLQIVQKDHFQVLSDRNRIRNFVITPDRGLILDRNNNVLAESNNEYFALFDRSQLKELDDSIEKVSRILDLSDQDIHFIKKQAKQKKALSPILIKNNLSLKEMYNLEVHINDLPGILSEKARTRYYPDSFSFVHVLGFVGTVDKKDRDNDPAPLLKEPGFKIGKTGLEKKYDQQLRGDAGYKTVEINASRKIVRTLKYTKSIPGEKLKLTIDKELQKEIYSILEPYHSGSCMVMNAHTGQLLSFVSFPGFDSNLFSHKIHSKAWHELAKNPFRPLINKSISGLYAPGSVFKMIVALAALEKGIIKPTTAYKCSGHHDLNGHKFHCWSWKLGGHGSVNLSQAIALSCDVYFYRLAMELSSKDITNMAQKFGLGSLSGIEYPNEKKGLIPTKQWQESVFKRPWKKGDTFNLSIGQGAILTTPLQLCRMTAALVNGGRLLTPHLMQDSLPITSIIDVKKAHLQVVQKGMEDAINKPYGTAFRSRINKKGFEMGGKTGSTQVSRITLEQRKLGTLNDRPWELKEHALFVGFAPIHEPQFVTTVLLEHAGGGGRHAAPIGKQALLKAMELFKT